MNEPSIQKTNWHYNCSAVTYVTQQSTSSHGDF